MTLLEFDGDPRVSRMSAYRPEIDGIRAVAVSAVIALHAGAPLEGGFLGVDVFFVLSGFLITLILSREVNEERFQLSRFYERRIRRILPALFVVVISSVPFAFWLMPPDQMRAFERSIVALIFFSTNIKFYLESGYFAPTAGQVPLLHTWSLAVEEQFYVIFPLVLMTLWRLSRRAVMPVLGILALASLVAAELVARAAPSAAFYLLPFRAWELLAGALAGLMVARYGLPGECAASARALRWWHASKCLAQPLSLAGLMLISTSLVFVNENMAVPGIAIFPTIIGTVALLLWAQPGTFAHRVLSQRMMVGLGLISYSAYLWHQPLFAFARLSMIGMPPAWLMGVLTGVTLLLAYLSWRFIEQPFRDRSVMPRWPMWGVVTGTGVLLLAIGVTGHFGQGVGSWRFSPDQIAAMKPAEPNDLFNAPCASDFPSEYCVRLVTPKRWAVWGDSHSMAIARALAELAVKRHEGVLQFTRHSCAPALTIEVRRVGCTVWNRAVLEKIEADEEIHTVILSWRHVYYLEGDHEEFYPELPNDPSVILTGASETEKRAAYWRSFKTTVRRLTIAGKRVVVMAPVPELGAPLPRLMVASGNYSETVPGGDFHYYKERNAAIMPHLEALGVEVMPVAEVLCGTKGICRAVKDSVPLYFDIDHLSLDGARVVIGAYEANLWPRPNFKGS